MAKWSNSIWALIAFAIGEGNQLSGATIPWLSQTLFGIAGILILVQIFRLFAPSRLRQARDWLRGWQLRSPLVRREVTSVAVAVIPLTSDVQTNEIAAFYNSWLSPAAQNANQVLVRIMGAIRKHPDPAVQSHEALIQRSIVDEERAALSSLSNALRGIEPTDNDDLQERLGRYYRAYQGCRTWIAQGIKLTGVNLSGNAIYQEWRCVDLDFLRELKRLSGPQRYELLRNHINAVGWGENVTRDLGSNGGR